MDLQRPQFFVQIFPRQFLTRSVARFLLVLSLLVCLMLTACFGSAVNEASGSTSPPGAEVASEDVAESPTDSPASTSQEEQQQEQEAELTDNPAENTPAPSPTSSSIEAPAQEPAARQLFQIDPEQSEARFIVNEVLFGEPNEVIGSTTEVEGEIEIDLSDPTQTTIGEIQINARSLATDNRFRNRSLNRLILQSNRDEYQFITFTPTAIEGLPDTASAGDSLALQVTGDLQIRDIVQPVTFEVTVTADTETQITGLAQTTVQRADFELTIPQVEGVADVTEEVRLELEFVATASE